MPKKALRCFDLLSLAWRVRKPCENCVYLIEHGHGDEGGRSNQWRARICTPPTGADALPPEASDSSGDDEYAFREQPVAPERLKTSPGSVNQFRPNGSRKEPAIATQRRKKICIVPPRPVAVRNVRLPLPP